MDRRSHRMAQFAVAILLWALASIAIAAPVTASLYRAPNCGCCHKYVEHLRSAGFDVNVQNMGDHATRFRAAGVPPQLGSCHLMHVGGYVVVGHMPLEVVERLLRERPDIRGISLPGMPIGTPGMPGSKTRLFIVRTLTGDVYARL